MSTCRCPSCGAAVRPDAPWCLLCHRDLRPAPEPVLAAEPALVVERPAAKVLVAPGVPAGRHAAELAATWPCAACGAGNSLDSTICGTCGVGFLAGAGEKPGAQLRLPLLGNLARFGRGARLGIALGVGLLGALLVSGLLALAGKVFG